MSALGGSSLARYFAILMLLGMTGGALRAQDYRAKVQGLATDPSQAALSGAKVTLKNVNTGLENTRETDQTGRYIFDYVAPGTYTITVDMAGFSRFTQENFTVLTRGDVTVDAVLQLGGVQQSITVADQSLALELNTTSMAQTVTGTMLRELPVLARNPFTLVLLDPAVVNQYWDVSHRNPFYMQSSNGMDVGGSTGGRNDILLDGVSLGVDSRGSYAPPMDAVQEVSIQQNSVDASFGFSAGGNMSVSMKSGTNDYHGTAYYFGRNPALNAVSSSVTHTKNVVRNSTWGFTAGGPIKKNKLFTFFTYEGWNNTQPQSPRINTLPTDLERTGDFSKSLNAVGGLRTIYDPWSTKFDPATSTATRTPFPGNVIPNLRMDKTSLRFMQDVWKPNSPPDDITGSNNYKTSYAWWLKYKNISDRTDWNINEKWRTYARYSIFRTRLDNPNYANSPAVTSDNGGLMDSLNAAGDIIWQATPTTIVNFRFGATYVEDDYNSEWAKVGEKGLQQFWPNNPWYTPYIKDIPAIYYPQISVGNAGFGKSSTWFYRPRKYSYEASVAKDRRRHYMKAGWALRHSYGSSANPNLMNFSFSPNYTADTFISPNTKLSGDAWATFLLGAIDSGTGSARYITFQDIIRNQWGVYFQDDFKLNRRITLNIGVRYEYETAPVERYNKMSRYLDLTNPIPEMQKTPPVFPQQVLAYNVPVKLNGAWVFTDDGNRALYKAPRNIILPRLGLALRINDKTAVRMGYARYAIPMVNAISSSWYIPADGFNASSTAAPSLQGVPGGVLSDPFPASTNPLILPRDKSLGRYTNLGQNPGWFQQDLKVGINERFNFTLQREMPGGIRTDATFFYNVGYNFQAPTIWGGTGYGRALNMSDPNLSYTYKGALDVAVPNPFYRYLTPETFPGPLRNQANVSVGSLLRPYPQYGTSLTEFDRDGISNIYRALQLKAERAFSKGFSFTVAYNYNRERTDNFFNAIDQYKDNYTMLGSANPRHRVSMAGTYEFPLGKGRKFGSNLHPVLNAIVGGWSTSHIYMFNSGPFLRWGQLNVTGDPHISNPSRSMWFNTSAFAIATPYTPRTNPYQYDGLTGPGYWSWDSTLSKYFQITERFKLEFRMEAYNLPNAFMPSQPNQSVTSALFGRSTSQANYGREMQYTVRVHF